MKRVYYSVLCLAALAVAACNKEGVQTAGESLCANAYISSPATKTDRKSTRLNSSHLEQSRMPSSA